jgi:hypothetical protein
VTEPIVVGSPRRVGNQRAAVLAGIAVAVLMAVIVLPGILFGGGGDSTVDESFPPVASTTTLPPVTEDAPDETVEAFSSKNPFTPLVELSAPSSDPATGGAVDTTATTLPLADPLTGVDDPGFTFPIAGDGAALPDAGSTPTTVMPSAPVRQPDRVALLEVYSDLGGRLVASVRINDATYGVGEGEEFAFSYRVLDLDLGTRCATLLFGDDRFGLCEGDETSK